MIITLEEINQEIKLCKRCHRKLKDGKAIQLGYGPICYSKIKKNKIYLFEMEEPNV